MKKILVSILVGTFLIALGSCNWGGGKDEPKTDTTFKSTRDIDTVKMKQQDTCIPEKKVDNSKPE